MNPSAMRCSLLAFSLAFAGSLSAQMPRLPGLPVVSPPVDHPALAGQPLMGSNAASVSGSRSVKRVRRDPSTSGVKIEGKALKKAVAKVKALPWHKKLSAAKWQAQKSGKPILLLQTLGDIGGYA